MNTALMSDEQKANLEAMECHFRRECKRQALDIARACSSASFVGILLDDAELIYQWLIKTDA
jgi:hypothetical protein